MIICSSIIFCSCGKSNKYIDMNTYFDSKYDYTVFSSSENMMNQVSTLISQNNENLKQYQKIKLSTMSDYSYGLTLHYITFDIYCTKDTELEFQIDITKMKNQQINTSYSERTFTKIILCTLKKENYCSLKVLVEDEFLEGKGQIIITCRSPEIVKKDETLLYNISNLKVYAEHI